MAVERSGDTETLVGVLNFAAAPSTNPADPGVPAKRVLTPLVVTVYTALAVVSTSSITEAPLELTDEPGPHVQLDALVESAGDVMLPGHAVAAIESAGQ